MLNATSWAIFKHCVRLQYHEFFLKTFLISCEFEIFFQSNFIFREIIAFHALAKSAAVHLDRCFASASDGLAIDLNEYENENYVNHVRLKTLTKRRGIKATGLAL